MLQEIPEDMERSEALFRKYFLVVFLLEKLMV